MVYRQEQRAADPERDHAHRSLFYEALTACDPDELPNLAFIAVGWNRRDPDELFEYSLGGLLIGIDLQRGWLAQSAPPLRGAGAGRVDLSEPVVVSEANEPTMG
jgi:hypothetical protein